MRTTVSFEGTQRPVFEFGSNLAGRHGKGAAPHAKRQHGAVHRLGEFDTGCHGLSHGLAVDHRGGSELREALGGARDVAGFAFRLADSHVLVRARVVARGRGGVGDVVGIPVALAMWTGTGVRVLYRIVRGWMTLSGEKPMPVAEGAV